MTISIDTPIQDMTTNEILKHNNVLRGQCRKLGSTKELEINSAEGLHLNIAEREFLRGFTELFFDYSSESDIPNDLNIVLEACKNGAQYARREVVDRCINERQALREFSSAT